MRKADLERGRTYINWPDQDGQEHLWRSECASHEADESQPEDLGAQVGARPLSE